MKKTAKFALSAATLLLASCGGDSFDFDLPQADAAKKDEIFSTDSYDIYVPDGMGSLTATDPYFDGHVFSAGDSLANIPSSVVTTYSARDVVAFIAERDAYSGEMDVDDVVETVKSSLGLNNLATVFKQDLNTNEVIATYLYSGSVTQTVTELATVMINGAALEQSSESGELTTPPQPLEGEASATEFQVLIGVSYREAAADSEENNNVLILAAVVPNEMANAYASVSQGITSTSSVSNKGDVILSGGERFSAKGSTDKADFLFVIDNSGSMSDDQDAISTAVDAFVNAITTSGLDAEFATITTDSSELIDSNADGGFTASIEELKADVKPGTGGSATESGIYHAEQALFDTALGDAQSGSVVTAGYPRADASVSVIMLSDESDQYSRYAGNSTAFDLANNLFIDRNYQVYSIVKDDYRGEDYIELSNNTAGSYADIDNLQVFDTIMEKIALNAGSASSRITLAQPIIRNTLEVRVEGNPVNESSVNGWQYNEGLRTLAFFGAAKPQAGDQISVSYRYRQSASAD